MNKLVNLMRDYASENYWHHSWDIVAARWSNDEIEQAIKGATCRRGAIAKTWGKLRPIDEKRKNGRPVRPVCVFEFLASLGGLRHDPELKYILDGNPMVPRYGRLLRETGMTLDRARAACVEGGYLEDTPWDGGVSTSTINDLLELIDDEARGTKRYPINAEREFPAELREEAHDDQV